MEKIGCDGITEPILPLVSTEKHWGQNIGKKRWIH